MSDEGDDEQHQLQDEDDNEESPESPPPEPQTEKESTTGAKPLTMDMVATHLSVLARTGNGLAHAYTRLEIHGEAITNLDALEYYPHLRYLDLSQNSLKDIDALAGLEYLLSLNLHSNALRTIPSSMDKRKYLQHANFAKNRLEVWDINSWPMLAWLNINENKLSSLHVPEFHSLLHLEARSNRFTQIIAMVAPKLEKLYMGANLIDKLTNLDEKPNLQLLHLRGNKISSLEGLSENLRALTYLNLRGNQIEKPEELDNLIPLQGLKSLVLMENPIEQAPNYRLEIIHRLPKLERLDKDPITEDEREEAEQMEREKAEAAEGGGVTKGDEGD